MKTMDARRLGLTAALCALSGLAIAMLADVLKRNPNDRFVIEGHTDAVGADDYNMDLSQRRARAVVDYLATRHAVDRARLESVGLGRTKLVVPNQPADPRNRRVQILNVG